MSGGAAGPTPRAHAVQAPGAEPERWLYFLHGIFGAGRNWRSVARRLVESRPAWGGVLVDLRMHGESSGFPPPHTLEACAEDLERLVRGRGRPAAAVLGHSFGGKVALAYAARHPEGLEQAWIVDSTPAAGRREGSAVAMLEALRALPGPFASRQEAVEGLRARGFAEPVARWMATNLTEGDAEESGWRWGLDLDAMEALLEDFFRVDLWDVVEGTPPGVELHFVKAEGSKVLEEKAVARIERAGAEGGTVRLHRLPGGHWLNVDAPDELSRLLSEGLP